MEPASVLQAVKLGRIAWLAARPVTRVKRKLNKRRERLGKPLLEVNDRRDEGMIKEVAGSLARTAVPAATAFLAGQGVEIEGENSLLIVGLAIVAYGVAQIWSIVRKVVNKPRDV